MSSYDTVIVNCDLPDGFEPLAEFQTSDLEESHEDYEITKDGLLVKLKPNRVYNNKPYRAHHPFTGQLNLFYCGECESKDDIREYAFCVKNGIVLRKVGNLYKDGKLKTCTFHVNMGGEIQVQIEEQEV